MATPPFWKTKTLFEMTAGEWESLCDCCGICCLCKFEDRDTEEIFYTFTACPLLDLNTCRCQDYTHRSQRIEDCIKLSVENVKTFRWLPSTCAYRLISAGLDLPNWHPLVSKNPETVHEAGISIRHRAVHESLMDDLEMEIIPMFESWGAMES